MSFTPLNEPAATAASIAEGPDTRFGQGPDVSLRTRAARGTIVNGGFLAAINALGLVKGLVVAGFLGAKVYGLWGLLAVSLGTLLWLAAVGVDDKYIQQDHPDQRAAFEIAFTLQSLLCGVFMVLIIIAVPLFSLVYGRPEMIAPGLVLSLGMPAAALQTPLWVFYRRMDFLKQRSLQIWDPIASFAVTVALAIAGLGVWALVLGTLAGGWAAAIVAVRNSPYPLRFRYERGALREYASFSWPLLVGSAGAVLIAQVPVIIAARVLGVAAVGAIALAVNISAFTTRVDEIVTQSLYPAICAVKDQADLLFESFSKSNRLAILWGVPCGVAAALFADDFVHLILGERWRLAVGLIQVFGLSAGLNQIGFNWTAFFRARSETRPIAVAGTAMLISVMAIAVPLLYQYGLRGFALGMGLATAISVVIRLVYLARIFPALRIFGHIARATSPTIPATAAVLLVRLLAGYSHTPGRCALEAVLFLAIALAGTLLIERSLIGEAIGYLRRRQVAPVRPAV